jgi:phospholipase/carboxylesterase
MATLSGPHRAPRSGEPADSLVVLLHGVGSNGDDLIRLADAWAEKLPHTAFHAPHGPDHFAGAPTGYQWYTFDDPQRRGEEQSRSASALDTYIDELLAQYELDSLRCILGGFSQGAGMSLYAGPRRQTALGGIVAFSGVMSAAETLKDELANKSPVCLIHGADDQTLPAERSEAAAKVLSDLEVPNEVHILPGLGHSIDIRGVDFAAVFMQGIIGRD